ncbi:MAG: DUF4129 domain-containing protein [Verrucomicrobiales bacterium]|nr:DUF4129 domain-containing protein [Verrucomicrobiales bacterium]
MAGRTLADYLAIAVSPILIMLMVGGLNFFLAEVGYRGDFEGQVYWTLFWFTIASVLVSRISIEQGARYGAVYGLALGAATAMRLVAFLGAPIGAILLLGLIWWSASKLTWDCTVIDDHADASGKGLLEHLKSPATPPGSKASSDDVLPGLEPRRPPHAPGRWLIYVSLGALPIFGCGQWLIPANDTGSRLRAFGWAALFVAAALGLLLLASFAGIRRYLRQRRITMPPAMASAWIARGAAVAVVLYFGAMLLPRPRGFDTWSNLGLELRARQQKASRYALARGEAAQGEGRRIGRAGREGETGQEPDQQNARSDQKPGGSTANSGPDESKARGASPREGGSKSASPETSPATDNPTPSPSTWSGLIGLVKAISVLAAILAGAWVLGRFGGRWWAELRQWSRRRSQGAVTERTAMSPQRRRFAEFENPFRGGSPARMSPDELAIYTFEALQAWAGDRGRLRRQDQTPLAFGQELESVLDEQADDVRSTVRSYLRAAYGGGGSAMEDIEPMRRLWSALSPGG